MPELSTHIFEQRQALMKTFENTYYFAYSTGMKKQSFGKNREFLVEPKKTTKMGLGFDSDLIQNLKLTGQLTKIKQQGRNGKLTSWDRIYTFFRQLSNPLSIVHKLFLPNFTTYE